MNVLFACANSVTPCLSLKSNFQNLDNITRNKMLLMGILSFYKCISFFEGKNSIYTKLPKPHKTEQWMEGTLP